MWKWVVGALNNGETAIESAIHEEKGGKFSLQQLKHLAKFYSLHVACVICLSWLKVQFCLILF